MPLNFLLIYLEIVYLFLHSIFTWTRFVYINHTIKSLMSNFPYLTDFWLRTISQNLWFWAYITKKHIYFWLIYFAKSHCISKLERWHFSINDLGNTWYGNKKHPKILLQMLLKVYHWPRQIFLEHKSAKLQSLLSWDMRINWTQRVFSSSFKIINLVTTYSTS